MTESNASADPRPQTVSEHGADAATRDEYGQRYGGEKLGKHPTKLVWILMALICVGVAIAGVAIIFDSLWAFIVGAALAAVAGIASLAAGVMNMTE